MKTTTRFHSMSKLSSWFMLAILVLSALLIPAGPAAAGVMEEWAARYNGPGNGYDLATAMAVDKDGNVYVTGWGPGSGTGYDYATVKYDPNGNQLWVARYDGPGYDEYARAIAVDKEGNIYVTGYSVGDYATIKYDPNGNELWVARFSSGCCDDARAIAVDASGNVYVTGTSVTVEDPDLATFDYVTVKYDPNGNQLWVARSFVSSADHSEISVNSIALDASGNVYVAGSVVSDTGAAYVTIKYDPNGNQLWVARYNNPDCPEDYYCGSVSHAMAVDGSGNVYVTGGSTSPVGDSANYDYATIKYDTNGNQLWVARYNGPFGGPSVTFDDIANAIAVDQNGNVYVTGRSIGAYATIKYGPNGNQLWVSRYNGGEANAIAVDGNGNVYVTGESYGSGPLSDYATVKYGPNGNQLWVARYNGGNDDFATAIAVEKNGNVYVTGISTGLGTAWDYATIKYKEVPDLAAGNVHSCALVIDGSVQCWGDNGYGQLGNGRTRDSSVPVAVSDITTATALGARQYHSCARLSDGHVQCWGRNSSGELGNGSTALGVRTPVTVSGITTATAVATGGSHACALLMDGSVQCWGDNTYGQLGDGSTNDSLYPVSVSGINTAIALGAGSAHTCALLADGHIQCWGYNGSGRLGNGNAVNSALPVPVSNISSATALAVGHLHSCALLTDSSVRCWGNNGSGRLGNGNTVRSPTPVRVRNLTTATAITAGGAHTCARLSDSTMQCWGDNTYGQLGNGSTTDAKTPVPVSGLSTVTAITTGNFHSCAALTDGSAHCWGRNNAGQLGNGSLTNSSIPVPVSGINVVNARSSAGEP